MSFLSTIDIILYMIISIAKRMCVPAAMPLLASAALASAQITCHVPVASPNGLTFDGANVWVASGSGSVMAINATTCAVTYTVQIGGTPALMAFDGVNVWVTDYTGNRVVKVSAASGGILDSYPVGAGPYGIVYDAHTKTIWIAISQGNPGEIQVMNLTDTETWAISTPTPTPKYLMDNGSNVYATDGVLNLSWYNLNSKTLAGEISGMPAPATGLVWDGANVWVAGDGDINRVIGSTDYLIYYTSAQFPECSYQSLAADHAGYLYLPCSTVPGVNTVQQFSENTLAVTKTITVPANPVALIWANSQLWVSSQTGNMVTSLNVR
jgi:DNA-binding beta-propeller fold protein YncE